MRPIGHPDYVYRPWTEERRAAARKRMLQVVKRRKLLSGKTTLTASQNRVLRAIAMHDPSRCKFRSAVVLHRLKLIEGDMEEPYWLWRLTPEGERVLNLAKRGANERR
jgi:hypothetical protein